jgi:hypothetical protein
MNLAAKDKINIKDDNNTVLVNVNADLNEKRIMFSINNKECGAVVINVCSSSFPLLFGISGSATEAVVSIVSLHKLLRYSFYDFDGSDKIDWFL